MADNLPTTSQSLSVDATALGSLPDPAANLGATAANETTVEPIPLPKTTDSPDTGGEMPKISPPQAAGTGKKSPKISKAVIVGATALFVLVSALVAGWYLVRRQRAGEIQNLAGTGVTPTLVVTPTITTIADNCVSLVSQMSDGLGNWATKTDSEFVALARPGDKVRFMCTGVKSNGNFTKSGFLINNVLYVDEVVKLNETQFAVEYVIPAAGALKVEPVLLDDSEGWVD